MLLVSHFDIMKDGTFYSATFESRCEIEPLEKGDDCKATIPSSKIAMLVIQDRGFQVSWEASVINFGVTRTKSMFQSADRLLRKCRCQVVSSSGW